MKVMKYILMLIMVGTFMNANANEYTVENLSFESAGNQLVGQLYLPAGIEKPPVVVVTGAWTTVKEQMPSVYAKQLVENGYAAFIFDFAGWGMSEGKNRFVEDPIAKTYDIEAAVDFLSTLDQIDAERIGGLGICASSGYMVKAYVEQPKLKTIALVATWLHNPEIATEVYGGPESVASLIAAGEGAQANFEQTGNLTTIEAASATNDKSLMYQAPYYTETDRGLIPAYDNQFNLASWKPWLTFDAISLAKKLPGKITFVHSEDAVIPHGVKQFAELGGDKVNGVWLDNITQFEFYDQPEPVRLATEAIVKHYSEAL